MDSKLRAEALSIELTEMSHLSRVLDHKLSLTRSKMDNGCLKRDIIHEIKDENKLLEAEQEFKSPKKKVLDVEIEKTLQTNTFEASEHKVPVLSNVSIQTIEPEKFEQVKGADVNKKTGQPGESRVDASTSIQITDFKAVKSFMNEKEVRAITADMKEHSLDLGKRWTLNVDEPRPIKIAQKNSNQKENRNKAIGALSRTLGQTVK